MNADDDDSEDVMLLIQRTETNRSHSRSRSERSKSSHVPVLSMTRGAPGSTSVHSRGMAGSEGIGGVGTDVTSEASSQ